jgi:hypothetical protein
MKIRNHHTVGTVPKSNWKIIEIDKIDKINTQIHERWLSYLSNVSDVHFPIQFQFEDQIHYC